MNCSSRLNHIQDPIVLNKEEFYRSIWLAYSNKEIAEEYKRKLGKHRRSVVKDIQMKFERKLRCGSRILDIGCGTGMDVGYFRDQGFLAYGMDLSEQLLAIAKREHGDGFYKGNMLNLNLIEEKYDGVYSLAALQHVHPDDLSLVLEGMVKLLVEKGIVCLITKEGNGYFPDMRLGNNLPRATYLYSKETIFESLEKLGMKCIDLGSFSFEKEGSNVGWVWLIAIKADCAFR